MQVVATDNGTIYEYQCQPNTVTMSSGDTCDVDTLTFDVTQDWIPGDPNGVNAGQEVSLQIDAVTPSGQSPDPSFNAQDVPFILVNENPSVGESAPSTVDFSNGVADASGIYIVQASGSPGAPSSVRLIVVETQAYGTVFYPIVYWETGADVERWKNCGFSACPNPGSYYCTTACAPRGFSSPTAFVSVTQGGLCGVGVVVDTTAGSSAPAPIEDCGPQSGGGCSNPYWINGNVPAWGMCLTDSLASQLGINNGCNGTSPYGAATVYWRFAN